MDKLNHPHLTAAGPSGTGESVPVNVRIDPSANAALAEAVRSARQDANSKNPDKSSSSEAPTAPRNGFITGTLTHAATALLFLGAGWLASSTGPWGTHEAIRRLEAETARGRDTLAKLTDELEAMKDAMTTRAVAHTASIAHPGQAQLAETIERLTTTIQDPAKKLTALEDRLTRMEGQIMAGLSNLAAARSASPAPASEQEGAPAAKPVKAEPVDGWVLREVYNGSALVESRNRSLYEVMPGNVIPGAGRVEAIERRGARWVVVTDKGFIGAYR